MQGYFYTISIILHSRKMWNLFTANWKHIISDFLKSITKHLSLVVRVMLFHRTEYICFLMISISMNDSFFEFSFDKILVTMKIQHPVHSSFCKTWSVSVFWKENCFFKLLTTNFFFLLFHNIHPKWNLILYKEAQIMTNLKIV